MAEGRANASRVICDRGRIIGLWEAGCTSRAIAEELGLHRSTVYKWISRWQEEGSVSTKPRSGRPKVTTPEQDEAIVERVRERPLTPVVKHTNDLGLACSYSTVRRRLHAAKVKCHVPAEKEVVTPGNKDDRMGFALQYSREDELFWNNVIFTDEKCFSSVKSGIGVCWRERNTRYEEKHIATKARSGRVSTSLWGWMWAYGPGELIEIEGWLTSEQYIKILEEVLLPTVRVMAIPAPHTIYVVHDRSPIHMSRMVREWTDAHPELHFIDWPSKGCDMNPIENLWAIMVQKWDIGQERTKAAIVRHAQDVWEGIRRRPDICTNLVRSMPRRLNEVIDAQGGWSSY